jgi:hypothetical protein
MVPGGDKRTEVHDEVPGAESSEEPENSPLM